MKFEKTNSLFLPKKTEKEKQKEIEQVRAKLPQFSRRTFEVYRSGDIDRFKKLVESKNGIFEQAVQVGFCNYENKYISFGLLNGGYILVYYYYEDINMEVYC